MSEDIPREPEFYSPSIHAKQQRKHRDIAWSQVGQTIQNGDIVDSHKDNCKLFIHPFESEGEKLKVVANVADGKVITMTWIEMR